MKKFFTSLLLLMAAVITADAEMTTVCSEPVSVANWQGKNLDPSIFASLQYGDKMVFAVQQDVEGATAATTEGENHMYYQLQVASWNNGVATYITEGDNGVVSVDSDGDVTVELTDEQVDAVKASGLTVSGHYVIVNSIAIGTEEEGGDTPDTPVEDGATTEIWSGTHAFTNWDAVDLSYDNKGGLASAKVGDVITVTYTDPGEGANIRIGNGNGWAALDGNAEISPAAAAGTYTFDYEIPNASILEIVQLNGIIVTGNAATVTKVELTTYPDSYDAVPVTIGKAGITTYSHSDKSIDFSGTGVTAYYASAVETGKVSFTSITQVPGYTGVIVRGEPDTYDVPVIEDMEGLSATNYLKAVGSYATTVIVNEIPEGVYRYELAEGGEPTFSRITVDTEMPAHSAYLETSLDITPADGDIVLDFQDGGTSGIEEVGTEAAATTGDDAWYNLQGMRVERPAKGIYIHNGKKVMIK